MTPARAWALGTVGTLTALAPGWWLCTDTRDRRWGDAARGACPGAMINLPSGTRIWIACGVTDLRNGFDGLAGLIQTQLSEDPFSGQLFVFRGRRIDR